MTCRLAYVVESTSHVVEAALERNAADTRRPAVPFLNAAPPLNLHELASEMRLLFSSSLLRA